LEHVTLIQSGDVAVAEVQACTGTLLFVVAVQTVDFQLLPALADACVQLATAVGPTTIGLGQLVEVQLFPTVASAATQL
jgi:hypothetical protein